MAVINSEYLTLQDTATRLGIAYSTLRKWIAEGRLPENLYLKAPRLVRFRRQALEEWLVGKEFVDGKLPAPPKLCRGCENSIL